MDKVVGVGVLEDFLSVPPLLLILIPSLTFPHSASALVFNLSLSSDNNIPGGGWIGGRMEGWVYG